MKRNRKYILTLLAFFLVVNNVCGQEWKTLTAPTTADDYSLATGNYKLSSGGIKLTGAFRYKIVDGEDIVIDLNGATFDVNYKVVALFSLEGGKLTIMDSSSKKTGKIKGSRKTCFFVAPSSGKEATLYLKGGTIEDCHPSDGEGGAIEINDRGTVVMSGGTIKNCQARQGAGVYVNGGTFEMTGGTISGNKVFSVANGWTTPTEDNLPTPFGGDAVGGGVYVYAGTFKMTGGVISNNVANSGGGVFLQQGAEFTLSGGSITNNYATSNGNYGNGGGVYLSSGSKFTLNGTADGGINLSGNRATRYGGGIYVNSSTIDITNCNLTGNYAKYGGGLAQEGAGINVTMTLNSCTITNNKSISEPGGGVYMANGTLTIGGTTEISNNESKGANGGGIYMANGTVTFNNGTFAGNKANNGGGIYMKNGTFRVNGTVEANENVATNGNGGAIYLGGGSFTVNGKASVASNKANNGGGICVENGSVTIAENSESLIQHNEATGFGGGLYVSNTSSTTARTVTFSGGHFVSNTAANGGGVALNGKINLILNGDIEDNLATNGGGLYLGSNGSMSFGKGLIRNNQATKNTTSMSSVTAYQKGVANVTGIGGGLFMDSNTSLEFTDEKQLGLYGNIASNGADDIFANGVGTNVKLPNVESMILTDFKVPTKSIYWVEDYITNDTGYDKGTKQKKEGDEIRRYRDALELLKDIYKVSSAQYNDTYLCLALGYRLVFATIVKEGLKAGESAIFKVYPVGGNTDSTAPYASVLLTGSSESNSVSKRIALAEGKWRVEETNWSWNYTTSQDEAQKAGKDISESNSEEDNTFTFTNSLNSTEIKYDEAIKVNTMGGTSTTAQ